MCFSSSSHRHACGKRPSKLKEGRCCGFWVCGILLMLLLSSCTFVIYSCSPSSAPFSLDNLSVTFPGPVNPIASLINITPLSRRNGGHLPPKQHHTARQKHLRQRAQNYEQALQYLQAQDGDSGTATRTMCRITLRKITPTIRIHRRSTTKATTSTEAPKQQNHTMNGNQGEYYQEPQNGGYQQQHQQASGMNGQACRPGATYPDSKAPDMVHMCMPSSCLLL
jgi:hypothetical protein